LQNDAISPFPFGRANILFGSQVLPDIMQFTVNAGCCNPKPIPQTLRLLKPPIQPIATPPVRQRFLTLVEVLVHGPVVVLQNFVYWDEAENYPELMERPKVDTVEQWNIINLQPVAHPMHLHLVLFQILNRQKIDTNRYMKAYLATGLAHGTHRPRTRWTDGASWATRRPTPPPLRWSGETASAARGRLEGYSASQPERGHRLIVPFGAQAAENLPFGNSFTGRYVWHCHMLDHEDNEMMLPYEVVP
jgi:spore coat protein A